MTDSHGTITRTYDALNNNRLIVFNGNTVNYDLDGNMLFNGSIAITDTGGNITDTFAYDTTNLIAASMNGIYP